LITAVIHRFINNSLLYLGQALIGRGKRILFQPHPDDPEASDARGGKYYIWDSYTLPPLKYFLLEKTPEPNSLGLPKSFFLTISAWPDSLSEKVCSIPDKNLARKF